MKVRSRSFPMNKFARKYHLVFTLCALCAFAVNLNAQDFRQVHPGVEYAEVEHKIGDDPVKVNLLRLDLKKVRLDVHHAFDRALGLETTSSIANRKGAVAAINSGFFRLDKSEFAGDASDNLLIDGSLLSEGERRRSTLFLTNSKKQTKAEIRHARLGAWLGSDSSRFRIQLSGVNRPRSAGELVLYERRYGAAAGSTESGTYIVLTDCREGNDKWKNMAYCARFQVLENAMTGSIPQNGYLIAAGKEMFPAKESLLRELQNYEALRDKKKRLLLRVEDAADKAATFDPDQDAVAGVPQLIKNGKIDITWEQEKAGRAFVVNRHPRTAVATLKDGRLLMITADGRQPGVSVGMTLQELADYLLSLGAVDAINLDGGGSTTMVLDGKVVNKPSDKEGERKVGDAIVVTLRKKK